MTDREFTDKMNDLCQSLGMAYHLASVVTDEDLDHLAEAIERADTLSFMLVKPLDFGKTQQSLDQQRAVLKIHRDIRRFVRNFEPADEDCDKCEGYREDCECLEKAKAKSQDSIDDLGPCGMCGCIGKEDHDGHQ